MSICELRLSDVPLIDIWQSIRLTKFDYRLANKLDSDLQKLRCRVNYEVSKAATSRGSHKCPQYLLPNTLSG